MSMLLTLFFVLLASAIGFYAGRLLALTVNYLPPMLLAEEESDSEPRDILKFFFHKNYPTNFDKMPFQLGIALLFGLSALLFTVNAELIFVLIVSWIAIASFITDYQYGIIPNQFTLSLVWIGLVSSLFSIFCTPVDSILGAVSGYGMFWLFNEIYRYYRGQVGMYPGDFKLNAGIGACVGIKILIPIIICSLLLLIGVTFVQHQLTKKGQADNYLSKEVPYGCYVSVVLIIFMYFSLAFSTHSW
jgi:leader peptidase (prepilin peptidase)/N-methyltransferase